MKVSRMSVQLVCAFALATACNALFACSSSSTGTGASGGGTTTTGATGTTTGTTGTMTGTTTTTTTGSSSGTTTGSSSSGTTTGSSSGTTVSSSSGSSSSGGTDGGADSGSDAGAVPNVNYTFDTSAQGWIINTFAQTGNVAVIDGGVPPTVTWDGTVGNPSNGSLKVTATFTAYNQYVDVIINFPGVIDLTGKIVHAKIMTVSGTFTGYAVVHGSSTSSFAYENGDFGSPSTGTWKDFTFNPAVPGGGAPQPSGWDSTQMKQIGIQLGTGSPQDDAGPTFDTPHDVVFQIDTVTD